MRNMDRVIVGSLLVLGLSFGSSAHACSTDGWNGGAIDAIAGSPPPPFSRYSELCAMKVSSTGHVQSTLASDTQYIGRFYVFPDVGGPGSQMNNNHLFFAFSNGPIRIHIGSPRIVQNVFQKQRFPTVGQHLEIIHTFPITRYWGFPLGCSGC